MAEEQLILTNPFERTLRKHGFFFFHFFFSDMQPDEMKNFVIVFQYDSYARSNARTLIAEVPFEASFVS